MCIRDSRVGDRCRADLRERLLSEHDLFHFGGAVSRGPPARKKKKDGEDPRNTAARPANRLMDEQAHMRRHRIGARGNITCFPLPWEDLLEALQRLDPAYGPPPRLPRSEREVAEMVHILLKTGTDARRKALAESIHAARVRRRVVVALIEEMVRRGHPAYRRVRMDAVRARAAAGGGAARQSGAVPTKPAAQRSYGQGRLVRTLC